MKFSELVKMAVVNIFSNKIRTFLTALGIIVGAATIVLVVAVGKGGQASVAEQFAKMNPGTIFVMPAQGNTYKKPLSALDVVAIQEKAPAVSLATVLVSGKAETSFTDLSYQGDVTGVYAEAQPLNNLKLNAGEFISQKDNEQRNKVTVLGSEVAKELFGENTAAAIGSTVKVQGRNFQVIGVLERLGDSTGGVNFDESAVVPYEVAEKYIFGATINPRMVVQAKDLESVPAAMSQITEVLRDTHRIRKDDDFIVRDAGSKLAAAQSSAKTMSVLLTIVAFIVLIVGGIGIMNVMLMSVKERTREIGVLKAIGARRRNILLQFLLEAVIISLVGGMLGIVVGTLLLPLMKYAGLNAISSSFGIVLGLLFSIISGTLFGYYPALKAAELSPVEALVYE